VRSFLLPVPFSLFSAVRVKIITYSDDGELILYVGV
jgi:hypothetical protein